MTFLPSIHRLLVALLLLAALVPRAGADVPVPVYRDAEMEKRLQAESELPHVPSAEKATTAAVRANAAAQARAVPDLASAARDLVVHTPEGVAAGWERAARAWLGLYRASTIFARNRNHDWDERYAARRMAEEALREAAYSLYAAYRASSDAGFAAEALHALGAVQEGREEYVGAELALTASLAAGGGSEARDRLERVRREHGFRVLELRLDADRDVPRACLALSAEVTEKQRENVADYLALEPGRGDHPVVLRESTVCVGNLEHGAEYTLTLRDGLTDVHGRTVVPDERHLLVPDRPPQARFSGGRYVFPVIGSAGIPLTTVNMQEVPLTLLRITEGNLVDEVTRGRVGRDLDGYDLREVADSLGERLWQGTVSVRYVRNREVVTAVPVGTLMPERKPGVYLLAVTPNTQEFPGYRNRAVQWLVVSDIGLVTVRGAGGLAVFTRSLATGEPMAGVTLALLARNEDTLAEHTTDGNGRATFAPGLLRGAGGREVVLLGARSGDGDGTFLALTGAGFDLSDRGVGGRPAPGPVDAYLYTDRGIYRPGETVHLTALVRNDRGHAIGGLPLELTVVRPDGVVAREFAVRSDETGAVPHDHLLADSAITGDWRFVLSVPGGGATVGERSVQVEDFVPPRIEVRAEAPEALSLKAEAPIRIAARFLYGAPAADLAVAGRVRVEVDPEPFPAWSGYRFGLVDSRPVAARADLPDARTGEDGAAHLSLTLPAVAESTHPLRARIEVAVLERGGRPTGKTLVRPLRDGRERIGIRPRFTGSVGTGAPAVFEIALVDGAGEAAGGRALAWHLYREDSEPFWYRRASGNWEYREIVSDTTIDGGELRTSGPRTAPSRITLQADWGDYRLEVTDPGNPGALPASIRFRVGWGRNDLGPGTPDRMTVRLDRDRYLAGDTATVRLQAPFDGPALVTVLTDRVAQQHGVEVRDGHATLSLPVEDWTAGAYVTATVFRPAPAGAERGPGRAVGLAWLAVDQPERRLSVTFDAPATAASGGPVRVPFQVVNGAGAPTEARLTVAAVDEGILQLTRFSPPDPIPAVFGKRRMEVDLRDLYGRLIDARQGHPGTVRTGGDDAGDLLGGLQPPRRIVALHHGLMRTDPEGRGEVVLDLPEGFSGRLRLMAVAHTSEAVGHGSRELIVRDPLVADLYLPRFLAPGDEARVTIELANLDAPAGEYTPALSVEGPARIAGTPPGIGSLARGERWSFPFTLAAGAPGEVVLKFRASGPEGARLERTWTLAVRPAQAWRQTRRAVTLEPGDRVSLSEDLIADLHASDARVSVSVSAVPYDLPGLLASLDRYPYGCTEQIISRALPLLYVGELSASAGSGRPAGDPELRDRIQGAVRQVLSRQRSDGSFGLWSARDREDPWVSAYALDFLDRARAAGFEVDAGALRRSRLYIDYLARSGWASEEGEAVAEAVAYGLATLARSRVVEPGAVRQFVNARLGQVASGLGRAQSALAAASFGLAEEVETALSAAFAAPGGDRYTTYGSELWDAAALVAVTAALGSDGLKEAARRLRELSVADSHTSTQEKAWMVVAAWELNRAMEGVPLTVDGARTPIGRGGFHRVFGPGALAGDGVTVANPGTRPVDLVIGAGGHPATEAPAHANGITLQRTFLTQAGTPADLANVKQGDELTVVLEGRVGESRFPRRLLVVDLLPAGLEIQAALEDAEEHEALGRIDRPNTLRLRDDRYVAALTRGRGDGGGSFRLAYLARAVTPGDFRLPAAYVEDMYDPAIQARGSMGRLTVRP